MKDIAIPSENEEELIKEARALGYSGIILLYSPKEFEKKSGLISDIANIYQGFSPAAGLLIDSTKAKSLVSYRQLMRKAGFIAARGFSNQLFEEKGINLIFELEEQKKDFSTFRNSGLNQVLCGEARKNRMAVGISFSEIAEAGSRQTEIIARAIQNITLCQKYGVALYAASFAKSPEMMRNPRDIKSLMLTLGMRQQNAMHIFL
ncbi:MAG: hypothetical protein NTZ02_04015 [Candidatus Woesearchaeota archaeon]|nr:hypothetical protein [Candidatus Woesearchaeota archaeon]